jgi:hypothetical protein
MVMAFATGCLVAVPEMPVFLLPGIAPPVWLVMRYRRWAADHRQASKHHSGDLE